MRLVHLSDLHLGLRAFERRERGWNLRERDLAHTFRRAVREAARIRPELVILSGDVFDHPDPPSTAFLTLSRGIASLQGRLPGVRVLVVAGERDSPFEPSDPGPVAVLDGWEGVEAVTGAPRAVRLRGLGVHVLLVPHRAALLPPFPRLRPDPKARYNLLVVRGLPGGSRPAGGMEVRLDEWDYVAVGGSHRHRRWGERAWCAGSLDRVGGRPWWAATEEKGFVTFDLARGEGELVPVPGRPVLDLAPVRVDPTAPEEGGRRLREVLEGVPGGIDGKIARIRLVGAARAPVDALPPGLVRALERRAAHLELRLEPQRIAGKTGPDREEGSGEGRKEGTRAVLHCRGGGEGQVLLTPGIWAVTAVTLSDRLQAATALASRPSPLPEAAGRGAPELRLTGGEDLEIAVLSVEPRVRELLGGPRASVPPFPSARELEGDLRADGNGGPAGGPSREAPGPSEARAREDWVEAAGEVEFRTMEWTRERQEAEGRLQAYRDRARELRARLRSLEREGGAAPCPTCGRALGENRVALVARLEEEWETVVQDGRWWKRRREQLDGKPPDLQALERRALRLHARVERLARVEDPGADREEGRDPTGPGAKEPSGLDLELIRSAGDLLLRLSQGGIQGLDTAGNGSLLLVRRDGARSLPGPGEEAQVAAALHLALLLEENGRRIGVVSAFAGETPPEPAVRYLDVLAEELASRAPRTPVLVVLGPAAVSRRPELFRGILELDREPDGRLRVRSRPLGPAGVRLLPAAGPAAP